MSDTDSTYDYYWYLENDDDGRYICIVNENEENYTGSAKLFYSKTEDLDTNTDLNEPTIPGRYHWALVWGALYLMGFQQFHSYYKRIAGDASKSAAGVGNGTIRQYHF